MQYILTITINSEARSPYWMKVEVPAALAEVIMSTPVKSVGLAISTPMKGDLAKLPFLDFKV